MSSAAVASPRLTLAPRAVDVGAIERGLVQLWHAAQEELGSDVVLTRACMSNLNIWSTASSAARIGEEIASIVERHPARVLLLVPDASDLTTDIEAYVSAQCHLSEGRRQVCSEYVTVSAQSNAVRRLPSVARPLLIGDLPTTLWWAAHEAPPCVGTLFDELAAMCNQLIYDSREWRNVANDLSTLADWSAAHVARTRVSDLAWRRLKPWRRLISEALDPAVAPGALEHLREVQVAHGPHGLSQALLLIGWLAGSLQWQAGQPTRTPDATVSYTFRAPQGAVRVGIRQVGTADDMQSVRMAWQSGAAAQSLVFTRTGSDRLVVTVDGSSEPKAALPVPRQSLAMLVAKQLPNLHGDPLFRDALQQAGTFLRALS